MYILISFTIPILTIVILLLFFNKKILFYQYALILGPSVLFGILLNFIMISYNTSKTEYLGYYITSIKHYDRWDEYIYQTCTREVPSGTDSEGHTTYTTETYDCSYVDTHPEHWTMIDNSNEEYEIERGTFNDLLNQWKTPMLFIDMHRDYYSIDGDCQKYNWDNKIEHSMTITIPHLYTNKIQATYSIFNLEKITKEEAKLYGLYDYPKVKGYSQNNIIGMNCNAEEGKYMNFLNGYLGKSYQFRTYLLAFYDKSQEVSFKQRSYWKGSNKNEFIICVGLDSISNKLLWGNSFSWSDDKTLEIMINDYLFSYKEKELNLTDLSKTLLSDVPKYWKRKEFKDFDYLKPVLTQKQLMWLSILLIIINIGISIGILLFNKEENISRE